MAGLRGRRVLVTRPRAQAQVLVQGLQARGAEAIELPLFEIQALPDTSSVRAALAQGRDAAGWIFTSANAARLAAALDEGRWPALYAVGAATARALAAAGHAGALHAESGSTSEDLLSLPVLAAVQGQHFLLCTGAGGRDHIEQTLQSRGATVTRVELYRRVALEHSATVVAQALARLDACVVTSAEGLERLHVLATAEQRAHLLALPMVLPSARVVELARRRGHRAPLAPAGMSDEHLLACLERALE